MQAGCSDTTSQHGPWMTVMIIYELFATPAPCPCRVHKAPVSDDFLSPLTAKVWGSCLGLLLGGCRGAGSLPVPCTHLPPPAQQGA